MDVKAMVIRCENGAMVQRIELNEKNQGLVTGQWVVEGDAVKRPASYSTGLGKVVMGALTPAKNDDEPEKGVEGKQPDGDA